MAIQKKASAHLETGLLSTQCLSPYQKEVENSLNPRQVDTKLCVSKPEEHVYLKFSVQDSGIGIPASQIDSVFQPFTQVNAGSQKQLGR